MSKSNKKNAAAVPEDDSSPSSQNGSVMKIADVDVEKFTLSEPKKDGTQGVCFINQVGKNKTGSSVLFQTDMIHVMSHGIPKLSEKSEYYKKDSQREFVKIPLLKDQDSCNELRGLAKKIDKYMASKAVVEQIATGMGKKPDSLAYKPLIRTPEPYEDEAPQKGKGKGEKKEYPIVDYIKAAYSFSGEKDSDSRKCETLFVKAKSEADKGGEDQDFVTMTDVTNALGWGYHSKYILYITKVWINKSPVPESNPKKYMYGVGLKVVRQKYIPNPKQGPNVKGARFDDEEDTKPAKKGSKNTKVDSDDEDEKPAKPAAKGKPTKKVDSDDDDSDSDAKPAAKGKPAAKKAADTDDDDDSDADAKPAAKGKPAKKADSDDEDSDADAKPAKGKGKPAAKGKAKGSDDEDDDEDAKPAKGKGKPAAKGKAKGSDDEDDDDKGDDSDDDVPTVKKGGKAPAKGKAKPAAKGKKGKPAESDEDDE